MEEFEDLQGKLEVVKVKLDLVPFMSEDETQCLQVKITSAKIEVASAYEGKVKVEAEVPSMDDVKLHRLWEEVDIVKVEESLAREARSKAEVEFRKLHDRLQVVEKVS
ncbi:hypothetical protein ACLOJK_007210 [Asimina triloba]